MAHFADSFSRLLKSETTIDKSQQYLLGLRGFLVLECFVWTFLQTFVPTAVKDAFPNADGPGYQVVLRETLSVIFWNENLLYSFFIFLSARTICIPFFRDPSKSMVASAVFRRGLRLWFPVAVSLALVTLIFAQLGLSYIDDFKDASGNETIQTPYYTGNTLVYFNSVFNIFWVTNSFAGQAGSQMYPSQTLWIISAIYMQSFTIYMAMVIVPYTRNSWRVKGAICFVISAWWVQSWAWYSISGLAMADWVMHMDLKNKSRRGVPIPWLSKATGFRIPSWILYVVLMAGGLVMQYLWTDLKPDLEIAELGVHTPLYTAGDLTDIGTVAQPQARDDNYLLIMGFFFLLESSSLLQKFFDNPVFLFLGRRSLSFFLVQAIIIYTAGIKLYMHMTQSGTGFSAATVTCLIVTFLVTMVGTEIFYRTVDYPSQALARFTFDWIRE